MTLLLLVLSWLSPPGPGAKATAPQAVACCDAACPDCPVCPPCCGE
jgi:hypothetical protein